jgi:chitinase
MKINTLRYASHCLSNSIFIFIVIQAVFSIPAAFAGQVTIGWKANTEPDLAGYKIYYGNFSKTYTLNKEINGKAATSCTISDLIEGQTYYFAATAYNTSGLESNYSEEVFCTITSATTTTINTALTCQHKFGDLNSDGRVTINEQVTAVRMYLGMAPVNPLADKDNDGEVQIWDVMMLTNCYLENENCFCLDDSAAP